MASKEPSTERVTHSHNPTSIAFHLLFGLSFTGAGVIVLLVFLYGFSPSEVGAYDALYGIGIAVLAAGAFLGPGLYALFTGYAKLRRRRAYDPSRLIVNDAPVPVGGRLDARLQVDLPPGAAPANEVHVELAEWAAGGGGMSSGGKGSKQWSETTTVRGRLNDEGMEVPISMSLPDRQFTDLWTVEVTAEIENHPDYKASFDLPVTGPVDTDLLY